MPRAGVALALYIRGNHFAVFPGQCCEAGSVLFPHTRMPTLIAYAASSVTLSFVLSRLGRPRSK